MDLNFLLMLYEIQKIEFSDSALLQGDIVHWLENSDAEPYLMKVQVNNNNHLFCAWVKWEYHKV